MKAVTVVGLGYVGLPLACLIAKSRKYKTYGLDNDKRKVDSLKKGVCYIKDEDLEKEVKVCKGRITATTDASLAIPDSDIVVVCVPTPVDESYNPDYSILEKAVKGVAPYLKKNAIFSVESTISPGTCRDIVEPILREAGFTVGKDIVLAHCPERIDPGNRKWKIKKYSSRHRDNEWRA